MSSSSPSSKPADTEDCNCENKSALKLSGDCLPCEELSSCEDIILLKDMTPTVYSSGDLICPVQGRWGPEGKKRRPDLQQLPLEDPQQIYKPGISVAWADDNGFESTAHENQCRGKEHPKDKAKHTKGKLDGLVKLLNTFQSFHLNDKEIQKDDNKNHEKLQRKKKDEDCDFLKLTMVEDLRLSTCPSAQLSHQEHEVCLESPMFKPTGSTDVGPFRELSATPKGQQHAERVGEAHSVTSQAPQSPPLPQDTWRMTPPDHQAPPVGSWGGPSTGCTRESFPWDAGDRALSRPPRAALSGLHSEVDALEAKGSILTDPLSS